MWPYNNVEDLARGKSLLLFLNSRGHHLPHVFVHLDIKAIRIRRLSGRTPMAFLDVHTVFLNGATAETYGKLDAWYHDDESLQMMLTVLAHLPEDQEFSGNLFLD